MKRLLLTLLCLLLLTACATKPVTPPPPPANPPHDLANLVANATTTVEQMHKAHPVLSAHLKKAKGVFVFPQILKAGLLFGAEGGHGVLLLKNDDGSWTSPAFYKLSGFNAGVYAGVQSVRAMFLLMDEDSAQVAIRQSANLSLTPAYSAGGKGEIQTKSLDEVVSGTEAFYTDIEGLSGFLTADAATTYVERKRNKRYYGGNGSTQWVFKESVQEHSQGDPNITGLWYQLNK